MKDWLKKVGAVLSKRSPEILLGMGITAMLSASVFAVKATPVALQRIGKRKRELQKDELSPVETVKATATAYVPAVVMAAVGTTCLICSHSISHKRIAALATAYTLSEQTLSALQDKVQQEMTKPKYEKMQSDIAKEEVDKSLPKSIEKITEGHGNSLFFDQVTGGFFWSEIGIVDNAFNEIGKMMNEDDWTDQNELLYRLGRQQTKMAGELGWSRDRGLPEPSYTSIITEWGKSCIVLNYRLETRYEYLHRRC